MLNFGASKPRVKGGLGPQDPPGTAPASTLPPLAPMVPIFKEVFTQFSTLLALLKM